MIELMAADVKGLQSKVYSKDKASVTCGFKNLEKRNNWMLLLYTNTRIARMIIVT